MRNIIKYLLVLMAVPTVLSGCLQEEVPYNGSATADQIGESAEALEAANQAVTAWLNESMSISGEHWDFGYPTIALAMDALTCDVAVNEYGYDSGALNWRVAGGALSDTGNLPDYVWMFFYRQIMLANNTLISLNSEGDGSDVDELSANAKSAVGQMLAFRGMAYLMLSRIFEYKGELSGAFVGLTVPYIDQHTTESEARNNPRVAHNEMYNDVIVRDLTNALEYLDGYKRSDKTEIDQSVVYGLLARTYLTMEEWSKAAEAARKAIDLSGAKLLTESQWTDSATGFNSMSAPSWMWAVHMTSDDDVVQTGICNWASFMASEATFGYCGTSNAASAKCIDAALYAKIPDTDWRKQSWLDPDRSKFEYQLAQSEAWAESVYDYTNIKFRPGNGNTSEYLVGAVVDFPMMRVEEMYLIEAEAKAMGGNASEGKTLLETFAKTRNSAYVCAASDAKGIQDEIFLQRQIELWGEGHIVFDYKRLNKPQLRGYTGTNHFKECRYNSPNGNAPWTTLPIPYDETITNLVLASQQNPLPIDSRGKLWEE